MYNSIREPVEYIVNRLNKKSNVSILPVNPSNNNSESGLPEYPLELVRDDKGQVVKMLHGSGNGQWREEFIRNATSNKIEQIKIVLPSGAETILNIVKDSLGKVNKIEEATR